MILDMLFPNRCLGCNRIIGSEDLVCPNCMQQIDFSHYQSGKDNPLFHKCQLLFPLESAYFLMNYNKKGLSQEIIHQLKYGGREKVGKILANWVCERINFEKNSPDLLVPVPLHPKKQKERGYNQLSLFTKTLSEKLGIPYDETLIKRNFYKKAQALQDKIHRSETENLFSITKNIENKHIMLIDDVFTTGNTISAIAWELLKNPTNKISLLVMARD